MTYDDNDVKGIRILRGMPLTKEGFPPSLGSYGAASLGSQVNGFQVHGSRFSGWGKNGISFL
jgi:hypothetical protein